MHSIDEQILTIEKLIGEEEQIFLESEMMKSILHSLQSLKQIIDCNLDFFVAVMHKDEYKHFIHYMEQKHGKQSNC